MGDARAMTPATQTLPRTRRAYDHRFREQVARFGAKVVARQVQIPRSTASTWRRRGLRPVITTEPFDEEKQHALDSSVRWEKRARALAAVVRRLARIVGMEPGRFHAWRRAENVCQLTDRSSCPRTSPGQLTGSEVAVVKEMVLAPEYRHMPLGTLARYAQRIGRVFAAPSTWAKLVGVRASQPNEIWHVDTTAINLVSAEQFH